MSLNPSCTVPECSVNSSLTVANLTVLDFSPTAPDGREHHWIWSVIEHPAVQAALTKPGSRADVNWSALLGLEDLDSAIKYYPEPPDYTAAIMLASVSVVDVCARVSEVRHDFCS